MDRAMAAFCRAYQAAFKLAIPVMPYREPEIFESIDELPELFYELRVGSVLLVTDKFLHDSGATARLEALLKQAGILCTVYSDTRANPTVDNVEAAYALYKRNMCQAIVAFGGGSSIDCAKAVGARAAYPNKTLDRLKGLLRVLKPIPPLVAIPTTAGTGSEVTVTAVITDPVKKHKYTMNDFTLIPHFAVLDPLVTYTLPPHLTATTGMDALTHAVEAYIGNSTTPATRAYALEATRLIFENILTAYHDPTNAAARAAMLQASYKAGYAFTQSYVGYIHAVAHSLGGQYNIAHGLANAVLMPIVLDYYGTAVDKKLCELGVAAGVVDAGEDAHTGAEIFKACIRELNAQMNIPDKLEGIIAADIPEMAAHAHAEANPLYPVPVLMDAKELEPIYHLVAKDL